MGHREGVRDLEHTVKIQPQQQAGRIPRITSVLDDL
jgi:hypothetical protein